MKAKKLRKVNAKFNRRLVAQYAILVYQEYGVYLSDPEEVKAFRKQLKREKEPGQSLADATASFERLTQLLNGRRDDKVI